MDLICEEYSEKAIVVRGEETKNCKEELKKLGGKYNAHLKNGAGWIFPKKMEDKVLEFVHSVKTQKFKSLQTPSNLLVNIEREVKKMSLTERLEFMYNVSKIAVLKNDTKTELFKTEKNKDIMEEDYEDSSDSELENPTIRKRLLLNSS
jgi:hypothetical protein